MNQVHSVSDPSIEALRTLGYSERESSFLYTVALHSGYFLMRQFARFLGRQPGGTTTALVDKLAAKNHVAAVSLAHNTVLYHLCARPFYAAIGQEDNRNRRRKQPLTIKNKLMALDFVLDHPAQRFLATEQDKLDYFGAAMEDRAPLPSKVYRAKRSQDSTTRYFVEKFPIFVNEYPTFCFVDEGLTTASRFQTFLTQYHPLFASLQRFHVLYVAASSAPFKWAAPTFERIMAGRQGSDTGFDTARLARHFAQRMQVESKDLSAFDRDKLIQYRNERQEFAGPRFDALFERWKLQRASANLEQFDAVDQRSDGGKGTFSTYLLRQNYDIFGTLTAF